MCRKSWFDCCEGSVLSEALKVDELAAFMGGVRGAVRKKRLKEIEACSLEAFVL